MGLSELYERANPQSLEIVTRGLRAHLLRLTRAEPARTSSAMSGSRFEIERGLGYRVSSKIVTVPLIS